MHNISIKQEHQIKQSQNLLVSLAMQQAFHVLQMPALELSEWMKLEIEQNPILEIDLSGETNKESLEDLENSESSQKTYHKGSGEFSKKKKTYEESLLCYPISLYEHLNQQARLSFSSPEDLNLAETLLSHLDERGFLSIPLEEIDSSERAKAVLSTLQTLEPAGVAATNLRDSLLIQLRHKQKELHLSYRIVEKHYNDLMHNRLPLICKELQSSLKAIQHAIQTDIVPLDPHPGYRFIQEFAANILPDILLDYQDDQWIISINQSLIPKFQTAPIYEKRMKEHLCNAQESLFVRQHLSKGKWLTQIVKRRHDTLKKVATYLIKKQAPFLSGEQKALIPMTLKEMAEELGIHESTATRAVHGKYISCPQGMFSLKSFFTHSVTCENGQKVSNHTLRQLLGQMIVGEDKFHPLSDEDIASQFKKMGIPCARRTVAKYREHLQIAPSSRRRKWGAHSQK